MCAVVGWGQWIQHLNSSLKPEQRGGDDDSVAADPGELSDISLELYASESRLSTV